MRAVKRITPQPLRWSPLDRKRVPFLTDTDSGSQISITSVTCVTLTEFCLRAVRQGMVIYVPPGDSSDPTRSPMFYDSTYHYLTELGIPEVK